MEKNWNKNAIRGDLTRGFEFLKYQVKRVTSYKLLREKQFFLTNINPPQFLSFEPCPKISLRVILLSYSHEHNICIKFIFATMYINFIILFTCWCQKCGITFLLTLSFLRNSWNLGRSDFSFLRRYIQYISDTQTQVTNLVVKMSSDNSQDKTHCFLLEMLFIWPVNSPL